MYRNSKLLSAARDKPCVMCGCENGTTVAAHSNLLEHGKGKGIKAHDGMVAWLCYTCHFNYDQGTGMNKQEKRDFILTAIAKTYMKMWDLEMIKLS